MILNIRINNIIYTIKTDQEPLDFVEDIDYKTFFRLMLEQKLPWTDQTKIIFNRLWSEVY